MIDHLLMHRSRRLAETRFKFGDGRDPPAGRSRFVAHRLTIDRRERRVNYSQQVSASTTLELF
jgi:hypothetical protein